MAFDLAWEMKEDSTRRSVDLEKVKSTQKEEKFGKRISP